MECWLGLCMSREGRACCHFKDAFIIFKILTSSSILLINWQLLIKHEIYFPFQYLFLEGEEGCLEGVLALDFLGGQSCEATYCNLQALKCQ